MFCDKDLFLLVGLGFDVFGFWFFFFPLSE